MRFFKFKIFLLFSIFFFNLKFFNFFNEEILLFFCFFTFLFFFYFYIGDLLSKGIDNKIDELRISFLKIFFELKAYILEKENFNINYKKLLRLNLLLKFFFFKVLEDSSFNKKFSISFIIKNVTKNIILNFIIIKSCFNLYRNLLLLVKNLKLFTYKLNISGLKGINKVILKKKLNINFNFNKKVNNFFFFNSFFKK